MLILAIGPEIILVENKQQQILLESIMALHLWILLLLLPTVLLAKGVVNTTYIWLLIIWLSNLLSADGDAIISKIEIQL